MQQQRIAFLEKMKDEMTHFMYFIAF